MNATEAHIAGQQRLRASASTTVAEAWRALPSYDETDVPSFLAAALPAVIAAQRASAVLTAAYLAQRVGRRLPTPRVDQVTGAAVRAGAAPDEVYRRPFVTVWSALKRGTPYDQAVADGRDRATAAAATDVQLSMRATLRDVGERTDRILGYARVPDPDACDFCRLVAGQRYTTEQLMPIHAHCGCGVDVITAANRDAYTGRRENDLDLDAETAGVRIAVHGELGPLLVDPAHVFTEL